MSEDQSKHELPSPNDPETTFRPMLAADLPLFARWVKTPAVAKWWRDEAGMSFAEISEKMNPRVLGEDQVRPYIFEVAGQPVGYIQAYPVEADPEALVMFGTPGAYAVDMFIGESGWLYRGYGTKALKAFIASHVFSIPGVTACVIDPEATNAPAIRAYEKAGFRKFKLAEPHDDGREYLLMRLEKPV